MWQRANSKATTTTKKKEVDVYKRGKRGAWNDKTRNEGEGWRKELSPTHEPLVQKKKKKLSVKLKTKCKEEKGKARLYSARIRLVQANIEKA